MATCQLILCNLDLVRLQYFLSLLQPHLRRLRFYDPQVFQGFRLTDIVLLQVLLALIPKHHRICYWLLFQRGNALYLKE